MKDTQNSLLSCLKAARNQTVLVSGWAVILVTAGSDHARAALPDIPRGVSVLNTVGEKALRSGILGNPDVDMISIQDDWNTIQPDASTFDFHYITDTIPKIGTKSVLLRMPSMGGSATNLGNTPDWVFDLMGVSHEFTDYTPGVTYSYVDGSVTRCIPVFWDPTYLAAKKALIAMAGAALSSQYPTLKIVVVSYANAASEDWNVPNDDTTIPSQVALWLNDPDDKELPGAGYTTQKMIDAAIHQGDAPFKDGQVNKKTLTSSSAAFTQADIGCAITGPSYRKNTHIVSWISPTTVTLDRTILSNNNKGAWFTVKARKDGLIDVAMYAFPNQYISGAVGGNGPLLDEAACAANGCEDPGTFLAKSVDDLAQQRYPGRYIVQRNNVSATIPLKQDADESTAWFLLADAADHDVPTAGQALGECWENEGYRMNGGSNCNRDDLSCSTTCQGECCEDDCALDWGPILQHSADHLLTYSAYYYEIYPPDAGNLKDVVSAIHAEFNPTPTPTPTPTP